MLLLSDGTAVASGSNYFGECDIPDPASGTAYTHVATGQMHTVLLQSDGTAVACGANSFGKCRIPALATGTTYVQVAAGDGHTVLLRSDGTAVACGLNGSGQCNIPALAAGATYTHVAAGVAHTVLLLSDGTAVACGRNRFGQCDVPPNPVDHGHLGYVVPRKPSCSLPVLVLQASFDVATVILLTMAGQEFCKVGAAGTDLLSDMYFELTTGHLAGSLGSEFSKVDVLLPEGVLLSDLAAQRPGMRIEDVIRG